MDAASAAITIIAAIFSGIGGIILQKHWSDKKPTTRPTSISFEGPLIQIPQDISELTKLTKWGAPLEGFVSFKSLLEYEREQGVNAERINQAKTLTELWLKKHQDALEKETLSKSTLQACPYFQTPVIGSLIYGDLRRRKTMKLPISDLDQLTSEPIFEIQSENDKAIILHLGDTRINFPISSDFGEDQKLTNKILAYSFRVGNTKNVRWAMEHFINGASTAIINLDNTRKALQKLLKQHAVLKLGVTITNTGSAPQQIKPYGAVSVKYGDSRKLLLVQHKISNPEKNTNLITLDFSEKKPKTENQATNVPSFLDRSDLSPHIVVPGNTSLNVTFISMEGEETDMNNFIEFYQLGGVSVSVMLETTNEKPITSPSTSFSKFLSNEHKEILRTAANKELRA